MKGLKKVDQKRIMAEVDASRIKKAMAKRPHTEPTLEGSSAPPCAPKSQLREAPTVEEVQVVS